MANGETIISQFRTDPITGEKIKQRLEIITKVNPLSPIISLEEIPDKASEVRIQNSLGEYLIRVYNVGDIISDQYFYVNHEQQKVYVHSSLMGQEVTTTFDGIGGQKISSQNIFTKVDDLGNITENLADVIEGGKQELEAVSILGGAVEVIGQLNTTIGVANTTKTEITTKITEGETIVDNIETAISNGDISTVKSDIVTINSSLSESAKIFDKQIIDTRNALIPLNIVTYDGSNQATHPSVIATSNFANLKYWMAYTPYPNSNDDYENPCVVGSNTGIDWMKLTVNPIDKPTDEETTAGAYMSDTDLVYSNKLECWYRFNKAGVEQLLRKTTTDGVTWSEREIVFDMSGTGGTLSPSIIYTNGLYKMWYVKTNGQIYYTESTTGVLGTWSTPLLVTVTYANTVFIPWHIDVVLISGIYYLTINGALSTDLNSRHILMSESTDGLSFTNATIILSPSSYSNDTFDNSTLYRASMVKTTVGYRLYYGAMNRSGEWKIGSVEGATPYTMIRYNYVNSLKAYEMPKIQTTHIQINDKALLNNEELIFFTSGLKTVKMKNTANNEVSVLAENNSLANVSVNKALTQSVSIKNGATGSHITSGSSDNIIKITNFDNADVGHLELASAIFKTTTNTKNIEGALRYNSTAKKMEFYNGTSWVTITSP